MTGVAKQDEPSTNSLFGVGVAPSQAALVVLSAPWEATTSYGRGTAAGPRAICKASEQVDLFHPQLGSPHERGLAMLAADQDFTRHAARAAQQALTVIAAHDAAAAPPPDALAEVNELCAWMEARLAAQVGEWLGRGKAVAVVGGDHSVAFGSIAAHAARYPDMGVLQIDAHADLRVAYQGFHSSHASVMHRVMAELPVSRLVSVGVRDYCQQEHRAIVQSDGRITAFFDDQLRRHVHDGKPFAQLCDDIARALPPQVYISFDIDGLDPALCPHTGTPVPGGLSYHQALSILDALLRHGRTIVGFDLCEVAPGPDEWDANVGARVLLALIGYLFKSRQ